MHRPGARRLVALVACTVVLIATGCGAGGSTTSSAVSPSPTAGATASVAIPADGLSLRSFGYTHGPVAEFSLPRAAAITASVDQDNNVTAVLAYPAAADVAAYLRRALPATGFTVVAADPGGTAITFTGYGWHGSFTGDTRASAILLRPG